MDKIKFNFDFNDVYNKILHDTAEKISKDVEKDFVNYFENLQMDEKIKRYLMNYTKGIVLNYLSIHTTNSMKANKQLLEEYHYALMKYINSNDQI